MPKKEKRTYENNTNFPIYRIVEGKRVLITEEQRDKHRRFGHTVDVQTGEQYITEYTDEQEKEANKKLEKEEAERPKREAEQKKREEEYTKFKQSLVYENRFVAFLDILGWQEAIDKSTKEEDYTKSLGVALNSIKASAEYADNLNKLLPNGEKWHSDPQITHFSDCLLVSVNDSKHAEGELLHHLGAIVHQMMNLGFLMRGAVTHGPLIHRNSIAYGPALVDAYKLENNIAKYPRIILDKKLESWGYGREIVDQHGKHLGNDSRWRKDKDGFYFYDYLKPFFWMPGVPMQTETLKNYLAPARKMISENLKSTKPDILSKYGWMKSYFNDLLKEHTECSIEPI